MVFSLEIKMHFISQIFQTWVKRCGTNNTKATQSFIFPKNWPWLVFAHALKILDPKARYASSLCQMQSNLRVQTCPECTELHFANELLFQRSLWIVFSFPFVQEGWILAFLLVCKGGKNVPKTTNNKKNLSYRIPSMNKTTVLKRLFHIQKVHEANSPTFCSYQRGCALKLYPQHPGSLQWREG